MVLLLFRYPVILLLQLIWVVDSATDERQLKAVMEFRKAYSAQALEGSNIPKVGGVENSFNAPNELESMC